LNDLKAPNGYEAIFLESVGSTNTEALSRGILNDSKGLWIVAGEQLQGKGSRGRNWISKPGNLYASLLIEQPKDAINVHGLTFVAAVALREALASFLAPQLNVQMKWPNDILVQDRKIAGILLEAQSERDRTRIVLGMGTNISHHPQEAEFLATSLREEGVDTTPKTVFEVLAKTMAEHISIWEEGRGFPSILRLWRAHAWGLGKAVTVKLPNGQIFEGVFEALENDGRMRVCDRHGERHLLSVAQIMYGTNELAKA